MIIPVADALPGPVSLTTDQPAVIGRAVDCRVVLTAIPVSKRHAELSWSGTAWCLRDLQSRNGTWINGWRIEPDVSVIVHHGDLLRLGSCEFEVHLHSEPQDQTTPGSGTYATRASIFQRLHDPNSIERDLVWDEFRKRYAPVIVFRTPLAWVAGPTLSERAFQPRAAGGAGLGSITTYGYDLKVGCVAGTPVGAPHRDPCEALKTGPWRLVPPPRSRAR